MDSGPRTGAAEPGPGPGLTPAHVPSSELSTRNEGKDLCSQTLLYLSLPVQCHHPCYKGVSPHNIMFSVASL